MANYYSVGRTPKDGERVELYMNKKLYERLTAFVEYEKAHRDPFDDFPSRTHIIEKAIDWYIDYVEEEREKERKKEIEEWQKILDEANQIKEEL